MAFPLPTRSELCGVMAGIVAWGVVAVTQAQGIVPFIATAAPTVTGWMKSIGILPSNFYYSGQPGVDPISGLAFVIVTMFACHFLARHWPSQRELNLMKEIIADRELRDGGK